MADKYEEDLRVARDELIDLYDEAPCGCLSIGRDGIIVRVNQTFLDWTGYSREYLLQGKRFSDLLTVPGKIFYSTQFAPLLQMQGAVREVAFDLIRPARTALPILLNAVSRKDPSGQVRVTQMMIFDATHRRRYERELLQARKNAERLTAVIACSGDAVFSLNVHGLIDSWNAGAEKLFMAPARVAINQPITAVLQLAYPEKIAVSTDHALDSFATQAIEVELIRSATTRVCVSMTVSAIRDAMEQVTGTSIIARDITDRHEAQQRLLHASLHDALTGLPNRALFADRVARCISRVRTEPNFKYAVLFIDLDRFKLINDSLGHNAGDKLLIGVAKQLGECVAPSSISDASRISYQALVARMGGDEFTVLLEDIHSPQDAVDVANCIGATLNRTHAFDGHEMFISASVGIAFGSAAYRSSEEVLRDADAALYRAKICGKARYAIFDAEMHESVVAHLNLENNLRRALERNEFLLHYQPLVALSDRRLFGFEALIRWQFNDTLISPADFIPAAEDMGLIIPIGRWVLEQACWQLAQWQQKFPEASDLTMAVNLSRKQFADPELVPHLKRTIARYGIRAPLLKLEITESVIMEQTDRSGLDVLERIKETGAMLAMDDFGTGYSSLSCLHKFPIDVLKLDRSFVADMGKNRDAAAVVSGVITLARNLGLTVIAEGLEKLEQVAFLQALDCEVGQGFFFSKPLPAPLAEQLISGPPYLAISA